MFRHKQRERSALFRSTTVAMLSFSKVVLSLLFTVGAASGSTVPGVSLFINGADETSALTIPQVHSGSNGFFLPSVTIPDVATIHYVGFSSFDDPFVNYFAAVENLTAGTQTYSFSFISQYLGGPYFTLNSSFGFSFTDGNADGIVDVGAVSGHAFISQPQIDGVNFGGRGIGCVLGGPDSDPGQCNSASNLGSFEIPATNANGTFGVAVDFTLSPGDIYGFNGRVSLEDATSASAPEPSTYASLLGGIGMVLVGCWRRSRCQGK